MFLALIAGGACAALLPFVAHAPNRLVSGAPVMLPQTPAWPLLIALALLLACAATRVPAWADISAGIAAFGAVLLVAGWTASVFAAADQPAARTEFSAGAWLMLGASALAAVDAGRRAGGRASRGRAAGLALACVLAVALATGALHDLGVVREYAVRRAAFWGSMSRHLELVACAAGPALLLGLPLGFVARRRAQILPVLGVLQTIPSLALFGLLIPLLSSFGAPGVGLLPASIALTLYALLPVAAATASGFAAVPDAVRDAARGVGFSPREVFWRVDVPLAKPVILSGVRVMVVQSIGLATVAALVGAGGLGSLVFDGLFANALDLVLLGTLPIVALALAADAALAAL